MVNIGGTQRVTEPPNQSGRADGQSGVLPLWLVEHLRLLLIELVSKVVVVVGVCALLNSDGVEERLVLFTFKGAVLPLLHSERSEAGAVDSVVGGEHRLRLALVLAFPAVDGMPFPVSITSSRTTAGSSSSTTSTPSTS